MIRFLKRYYYTYNLQYVLKVTDILSQKITLTIFAQFNFINELVNYMKTSHSFYSFSLQVDFF